MLAPPGWRLPVTHERTVNQLTSDPLYRIDKNRLSVSCRVLAIRWSSLFSVSIFGVLSNLLRCLIQLYNTQPCLACQHLFFDWCPAPRVYPVRLPAAMAEQLRERGDGNIGAGLRAAMERLAELEG